MRRTFIGICIGTAFTFLVFGYGGSIVLASPFVPLEWQQRVKSGSMENDRKHLNWVRDQNGDFLDDALDDLSPGDKTTVIVELSDCMDKGEAHTHFSSYGTVRRVGTIVAYVIIDDVLQEMLADLAKDPAVAGVEKPREIVTFTDTSTRSIRQRASSTYSPNTFADAFGYTGSGINIAIVDSGVDNAVHGAFAGKFVSGYNACTSTAGDPDCDMPYHRVRTGADGVCNTAAGGDDVQMVAVGQSPTNLSCIGPGPNGVLDTAAGGDDFVGTYGLSCNSAQMIFTGMNGICNTNAAGDDYQLVPFGVPPPDTSCISPGPNGVLNSVPGGDDFTWVKHHGTHVAGIALGLAVGPGCRPADDGSLPNNCAGVAPGAGLVDVKVLQDGCITDEALIIDALEWIWIDGNADVVNMSIGNDSQSDGTSTLSKVINGLVANGIPVAVAAGNSGGNCIGLIASSTLAITVAASDDQGTVNRNDDLFANFSTFGPRVDFSAANPDVGMLKPDITAPGVDIVAPQGETGNTADLYHDLGGTSMSSPHVAGAAALLLDMRYDIPPGAIKDLLKRTAFQTPQHLAAGASYPAVDGVYNVNWGYGLLDIYEAGNELDTGITDISFADCDNQHPDYPICRRCLLTGGKASYQNNVDIQLATDPPVQEQPNTITVTVENRGSAAAQDIVVCVSVIDFGIGVQETYDVGCIEIANLANGASDSVSVPWTPTASDHQCIQATIDYGFDTDFWNNLTQRNIAPVPGSSPAKASFRVANPLNEEAVIELQVELDDRAKKILEAVRVEGVPIGQGFRMKPQDCPILAEIQFIPNGQLPVGAKGTITVKGKAYSPNHEGFELSGVVFDYEVVDPGLKYAYSCGRHKAAGEIPIPLELDAEKRPTSDPRRRVQIVKAIFNVPVRPLKGLTLNEAINVYSWGSADPPKFNAYFTPQDATEGTDILIKFNEYLPNKARYTFSFKGLCDLDEDPITGDDDFDLRVLQGDANGSGSVTGPDVSYVRGRINKPVKFGPTSRADGNQSGTITATDISYVRGRIGSTAP